MNNSPAPLLRVYHVDEVPFSAFTDFCAGHTVTMVIVKTGLGIYRVHWCEQVVGKSPEEKPCQVELGL